MITIITEKPNRSVDILGYGVDSYIDKNGKKIYRVYGVVKHGGRGRLVSRDNSHTDDLYLDDNVIVIYRNEDYKLASSCKDFIDRHVAMNMPVFAVEEFKRFLNEKNEGVVETEAENVEVITDAN